MNNECIPFFEAAYTQKRTVHVEYDVTGCTFVGPLGPYQTDGPGLASDSLADGNGGNLRCQAAPSAGGEVGGVAGWDVASGGKAPVIAGKGTVVPVLCSANVAAGAALKVDTAGKVLTATTGTVIVGRAMETVNSGGLVPVELTDGLKSLAP